MTYSWSSNEENFSGEFETRSQALDEAVKNNPGQKILWTGENIKKTAADFLNIESIIDDMQTSADDCCGEASEDWLPTNYKADTENKEKLAALICAFVDETWPIRFWNVDNIMKHEVLS